MMPPCTKSAPRLVEIAFTFRKDRSLRRERSLHQARTVMHAKLSHRLASVRVVCGLSTVSLAAAVTDRRLAEALKTKAKPASRFRLSRNSASTLPQPAAATGLHWP